MRYRLTTTLSRATYFSPPCIGRISCCLLLHILVIAGSNLSFAETPATASSKELKVGWVGPMTGGAAKYAAWESAQIALDEINAAGGIAGKTVRLIAEDGQCNAAMAVRAAQKLLAVDGVKFLIGGHCSTESVAMASTLKNKPVLEIAALSSSPHLTGVGPKFFRLTSPSSVFIADLARYFASTDTADSFAVLHEETEYAVGEAETFKRVLKEQGGFTPTLDQEFPPGTSDFRSILQRIKATAARNLFICVQAPDTAELIFRQAVEQRLKLRIVGGSVVRNVVKKFKDPLVDGFLTLDFALDPSNPRATAYLHQLQERFDIPEAPLGIVTAEAYDALFLLKFAIEHCGEELANIPPCLETMPPFDGISGRFGFDAEHNPTRSFQVMRWDGSAFQPAS